MESPRPFELPGRKDKKSHFVGHEGNLVTYRIETELIIGVYHERTRDECHWMEFIQCICYDPGGKACVITKSPVVTSDFSGVMRPTTYNTIEDLVKEINLASKK